MKSRGVGSGIGAGLFVLGSTAGFAGGLDRTGQSIAVIFEQGDYAELSFGHVSPDVSGVGTAFSPTPGGSSGDMAGNYFSFGGAYKHSYGNGLDVALIVEQPFGAKVDYPTGQPYFATGSTASLESTSVTGVVKYTLPSNVSLIGGLRYQTLSAEASIPFIGGYTATSATDSGLGYLVGIAYEKPEIALRIALTYNSRIGHNLATTEFGAAQSTTRVESPRSVNLEFQSGVAADTLVFGSIRYVDWSNFSIDPVLYPPTSPIVSYDHDTVSYALGVGRKFSDTWSGAVMLGYEPQTGGFASNLAPTDGYWSIGLGGTYTRDNMKVTGGVRYVDIGDADTTLGGGVAASNFTGNSAIGFGVKVGFSF